MLGTGSLDRTNSLSRSFSDGGGVESCYGLQVCLVSDTGSVIHGDILA